MIQAFLPPGFLGRNMTLMIGRPNPRGRRRRIVLRDDQGLFLEPKFNGEPIPEFKSLKAAYAWCQAHKVIIGERFWIVNELMAQQLASDA